MWWAKLTNGSQKKHSIPSFAKSESCLVSFKSLPLMLLYRALTDFTHCCYLGENTANELQCQPHQVDWVSRNFNRASVNLGMAILGVLQSEPFLSASSHVHTTVVVLSSHLQSGHSNYMLKVNLKALLLALALWTNTTLPDEKSNLFSFVSFVGFFFLNGKQYIWDNFCFWKVRIFIQTQR